MHAFITGSRAYGKHTSKSDIDLVIRVRPDMANKLRALSDSEDNVRFGKLNLILCETDTEYAVWRMGTSQLMLDGTAHHKREAKEVIDNLRSLVGVSDRYDSGGK